MSSEQILEIFELGNFGLNKIDEICMKTFKIKIKFNFFKFPKKFNFFKFLIFFLIYQILA